MSALESLQPGYKRTEVGVIPKDWDIEYLQTLCAFITKGSTPTTYGFKWERTGILFLRSECVSGMGLDLDQSTFISTGAHSTLRRSEIKNGDLLITITGNVGRVVHFAGIESANINQHIARIRITSTRVDAGYIFQYLSQPEVRQYYNKITTGQAYPQISLQQVRETKIPLPPFQEQSAIAAALSDVNSLIAALDALIAKKRDIKQAAMQQLLTGKTRLPGFRAEWSAVRLRDRLRQPATYGIVKAGKFQRTGIRMLRGGDISNGRIVGDPPFVTHTKSDEFARTVLQDGDVVIALVGYPGETARVPNWLIGANISRAVGLLRPSSELLPDFLVYYLNSPDGRREFLKPSAGSAQLVVNLKDLNGLRIPQLPTGEQIAIAAILSDMDMELEAIEAKRDKTRALKQGMTQELLTGRIRLV